MKERGVERRVWSGKGERVFEKLIIITSKYILICIKWIKKFSKALTFWSKFYNKPSIDKAHFRITKNKYESFVWQAWRKETALKIMIYMKGNIKINSLSNRVGEYWLGLSHYGDHWWALVDMVIGCIEDGEFLDYVNDVRLFKNISASWNWLVKNSNVEFIFLITL
jgi:hypothetical protein